MYILQTVSRSGPRARPEPPSPSPDLGLRMDRATGPASPSPVAHPNCDGSGGWPKVAPVPVKRSDKDDEEEEGEKCAKTKRKKKKRKKEPKEGKWTFGGLFRRKKKKDDDLECAKDSTEEECGSRAKEINVQPSLSVKRTKDEEDFTAEKLGHPCTMHNGCVGCVGAGRPTRSRQRSTFGSGSDLRDPYCGYGLVRRDSSTSSHRERKELIKARVEAMRERLPKDSSSEDEGLPGGSEGSWEWRGKRVPGGHPPGGIGSAGSSPYMGRRSRFMGRTERFHQRRLSREYRDEAEEEETWRRRPNGLPPQCVPWRVSQSDVEAPYIGCRLTATNSGTTVELSGVGSGSALSYSPAQSPLQSPMLGGRRSANSATSPIYGRESVGLPFHGSNRCIPRRYPSTPISPQSHCIESPVEGRTLPVQSSAPCPTRSRSTDVLLSWRPEDGNYQGSEPNPFHFPIPKQQTAQRPTHEPPPQFHQRWPSAPCRSPPPPPPPRDPQRRIATPQSLSHFQMRDAAPPPNESYVRRPYQHPPPPHGQVQQQESPYMNVQATHVHPPLSGGPHVQSVTCLADSQPRSRRPLRVTAGTYFGRSGEVSYMSDSQIGPVGRRPLTQQPPLESHYAVPFLADSPPPRCVMSRVLREPQVAEQVVHSSRPLMRQQRAPVFSRSRSSSPAPSGVNPRPFLLPLRHVDSSNDSHPFAPKGHSSAPQTPIDGPVTRPLSIVSEERSEIAPKVAPVPPARSSSRRSSVSSLDAMEFGVWGMDRPSRSVNRGPSGLEDALTELENIYKSLKFDDDVDGETDSNVMGSSELGLPYDDQDRPLTDDMAYRRLHSKEKTSSTPQQGVGGVVAQAGSYLLVSPTLGPADPWTEPPPNSVMPGEPDITLDDVVFRSIRQANAHISTDPQPPFGIPLGPVTRAPDSDYLHAKPPSPSPSAPRASSCARRTPDIVKDDLAFRSLRKDRISNGTPVRPVPLRGVSSPPPPRPSSSFSCVSSPPPLPSSGLDFQAIRKKRAVRSLSANLLGILQTTNLSGRPSSPPSPLKAPLPPPSPPSPRKEFREVMLPAPPKSVTSPPKYTSISPSVVASEDSESCVVEVPLPGNDATSSDTMTEGHADEPKRKPDENKDSSETQLSVEPPPPVMKNSPGEVYEALGRVLSRVGREPDSSIKGTKAMGAAEEDDLESLLVALAREARTTSENLGRELDQLRTATVKSSEDSKKPERIDEAVVREFDQLLTSTQPKEVAMRSEAVQCSIGEAFKPAQVNASTSSMSPAKSGAIASLGKSESYKSRMVSTASPQDPVKSGGLSVVVGKCTVGKDLNQPGAVSFTSSVSPIKSGVMGFVNRSESDQLREVSAPSAEDPMKAGGVSATVRKESDKPSTVSATSAKVPIKSGSLGFIVVRESDQTREAPTATIEDLKRPGSFAFSVKKESDHLRSLSLAAEKDTSKSGGLGFVVTSDPSESNIVSASNVGDTSSSGGLGFTVRKQSDQSSEIPRTTVENITITGSMRLVVRRDTDSLRTLSDTPPQSPVKSGSVFRRESEQSPTISATSAEVSQKSDDATSFSGIASNQVQKSAPADNTTKSGEIGFVFGSDADRWRPTESKPAGESMSPGAVVDEIQKEFDRLFAIPAKKARKSKDAETETDLAGPSRTRITESKSLEHPKHATEVRSVDQLLKTFPKSLGSADTSRESNPVQSSDAGRTRDGRKSDAVSTVFDKEFDELWRASTKSHEDPSGAEALDSAFERELEQLRAVKKDAEVAAEELKGSADITVAGVDAEGEVGATASSGCPEDSKRAACTLKPAVASPACLTLGTCYPRTAADTPLDPTTFSSMILGLFPEAGDPLFTALAAFLALVSLVAAIIVRPF